MSNSQRTIAELTKRRADLLRQWRKLMAEARMIGREIEAVRAELRIVAPRLRGAGGFRHLIRRAIKERPMLTTELTLLVMREHGLDVENKALRHTMRKRVHACLKELRRNGEIVSECIPGRPNGWRIADQRVRTR